MAKLEGRVAKENRDGWLRLREGAQICSIPDRYGSTLSLNPTSLKNHKWAKKWPTQQKFYHDAEGRIAGKRV